MKEKKRSGKIEYLLQRPFKNLMTTLDLLCRNWVSTQEAAFSCRGSQTPGKAWWQSQGPLGFWACWTDTGKGICVENSLREKPEWSPETRVLTVSVKQLWTRAGHLLSQIPPGSQRRVSLGCLCFFLINHSNFNWICLNSSYLLK